MTVNFSRLAVVGTGAMGRGIAQIAAQAGSEVRLLDAAPGAASQATDAIRGQWQRLADKGRLTPEQVAGFAARLKPVASAAELAGCDLVIEAIVERLDAKRALFAELERTLG